MLYEHFRYVLVPPVEEGPGLLANLWGPSLVHDAVNSSPYVLLVRAIGTMSKGTPSHSTGRTGDCYGCVGHAITGISPSHRLRPDHLGLMMSLLSARVLHFLPEM